MVYNLHTFNMLPKVELIKKLNNLIALVHFFLMEILSLKNKTSLAFLVIILLQF